jgi:predicted DNA-binding protein
MIKPNLHYKKIYQKQLRENILTLRLDFTEMSRLFRLCDLTRRNKSDIVREAIWDVIKKYPEVI